MTAERDATLTTTVVDALDALDAHVVPWRALLQSTRLACAYQSPAWVISWFREVGSSDRPHVVLFHADGELVGVAPFAVSQVGVGTLSIEVTLTAATEPGDYGDPLFHPAYASRCADALVDHLVSLTRSPRRVVSVRRIDVAGALNSAIEARDDISVDQVTAWSAPVTSFEEWDDPRDEVERIAASLKLPKQRRRLERDLGPVSACFQSPIDRSLVQLAAFHRARFGVDEAPRLLQRPKSLHLMSSAMNAFEGSGMARMCALHAGDHTIALEVGHNVATRWVGQAAGFDVDAGKYRPGFLLVHDILRAAIDEGASEYDHGQGARPYKLHWATGERRVRSVVLSAEGILGRPQRLAQRLVASHRARKLLEGRAPAVVA